MNNESFNKYIEQAKLLKKKIIPNKKPSKK